MLTTLFDTLFSVSTVFCESTDLVVIGDHLPSTIGYGRFSKIIMSMISIPFYYYSVIIGLLLSDGWITFAAKHAKNARLGFVQSLAHFDYLWYVFTILSHYCSSFPHFVTGVRFGTKTFGLQFFTRSLPCFTELHKLFYVDGVKIVPADIFNLLTPLALAHWIQGDGSVRPGGLELCTDSFTIQDVVRLMNVLMVRYELD